MEGRFRSFERTSSTHNLKLCALGRAFALDASDRYPVNPFSLQDGLLTHVPLLLHFVFNFFPRGTFLWGGLIGNESFF